MPQFDGLGPDQIWALIAYLEADIMPLRGIRVAEQRKTLAELQGGSR